MKIYIDLVLFLNFAFDFLLLLTVSIILKRNIKIKKIVLGSLIGSLTILFLFIKMSSVALFLLKIIFSIIILLTTFGFKDIKYFLNNILYFYTTSIVLGGFLYYLNIEFSYKNIGLIFYHNGLSINFIFLVIFSPIILYIYIKQVKELKYFYSLKYKVDAYMKDGKVIDLNAYLDTGNILTEPYKNRNVVIVNDKRLSKYVEFNNYLIVPYTSLNKSGLMKCVVPKYIYIDGVGIKKNVVIGVIEEKLNIDGINCLLNNLILEGL